MIIAIMNNTMDRQKADLDHVWVLDVSYRIMRYEQIFPELTERMQRPVIHHSIWTWLYWESFLFDMCLACYCIPEVHLQGLTGATYFHIRSAWVKTFGPTQKKLPKAWSTDLQDIGEKVEGIVKENMKQKKHVTWESQTTKPPRLAGSIREKIVRMASKEHAVAQAIAWSRLLKNTEDKEMRKPLLLVGMIYEVIIQCSGSSLIFVSFVLY